MVRSPSTVASIVIPAPPALSPCPEGVSTQGQAYALTLPGVVTEPLRLTSREGVTLTAIPAELLYRGTDHSVIPDEDEEAPGVYDYIAGSAPAELDPPTGNQVRYRRVFPESDDVYEAKAEGIKQHTILREKPRNPAAYITGPAEFGVSSLIGGVTLPLGLHESMSASGFIFRRPVARDMTGASVEGRYEVLDADDGQQVLTLFPASWVLSPERVYPINLDPTISTSTSTTATAYPSQQKIIRFPSNGVELIFYHDGTNMVCRYSLDAWASPAQTPSTGATVGAFTAVDAKIDSNEYLHVVGINASLNPVYLCGTPNTGRTGYTWTSPLQLSSFNDAAYPVCEPHVEGTGYKVHIWWAGTNSSNSQLRYTRLNIDAARNITQDVSASTVWSRGSGSQPVQPAPILLSDKSWYVTFNGDFTQGVKGTYSSGSWSIGSPETINTHVAAHGNVSQPVLDSQNRILVAIVQSEVVYLIRGTPGSWAELTSPSLTAVSALPAVDLSDNPYLFYTVFSAGTRLYHKKLTGTTWGAATQLGTDTNVAYINMRRGNSGSALELSCREGAGSPYNVVLYRVALNAAPTAPTGLSPNATGRDAAATITLIATAHDDAGDYPTDAQWELTDGTTTWYILSDGTLSTTPTWVPTGGGTFALSITIDAGELANDKTIQWRVKTKDQGALESPWSDLAQFTTTAAPTTSIVSPASGATISSAQVTVTISVSGSFGTATYRLYADDAGAPGALLAEHTGVTSTTRTIDYALTNATAYHVAALAVSTDGVAGAEVSVPVTVSFTPPAKPTIAVIPMADQFPPHVEITVTNPTPTGSQPAATGNRIERSTNGTTWTAAPDGSIAVNGTYKDYSGASGTTYLYRAVAIGDNGTETASDSTPAGIDRECWWFVPISDPSQAIPFAWNREASGRRERAYTKVQNLGPVPVIFTGGTNVENINISAAYVDPAHASPHADVSMSREEWRQRFRSLEFVEGYLVNPEGSVWKGILEPGSWSWTRDMVTNALVVQVAFMETGEV